MTLNIKSYLVKCLSSNPAKKGNHDAHVLANLLPLGEPLFPPFKFYLFFQFVYNIDSFDSYS